MSRGLKRVAAFSALIVLAASGIALAQSGALEIGALTLNKNGSAKLAATFGSAGTVEIEDTFAAPPGLVCGPLTRIRTVSKDVPGAGTFNLPVIPANQARRKIADGRSVKVVAQIVFTPTGGAPVTEYRKMHLHKPGRAASTTGRAKLAHAACTVPRPSN